MTDKVQAKGLVLIDETFELEDGSTMRAIVKFPQFKARADQFESKLRHARGIPGSIERPNANDPILKYYTEQYADGVRTGQYTKEDILAQTVQFYEEELAKIKVEAIMLAIFDNKGTRLVGEATPYPESDDEVSQWLEAGPKLIRNLTNPVEKALRLIYMRLADNYEVMAKVEAAVELINVKLNLMANKVYEVDQDGFLTT